MPKQKYQMISQAGWNQKETQVTYEQSRTELDQKFQPKSRRVATQQIQTKKSSNPDGFINFLHPTQFLYSSTKETKRKKQSLGLNSAIQKLIEQEINKGKIKVSFNQIKYPVQTQRKIPKNRLNTEQQIKQKVIQIQKKKKQAIQSLRQLEDEQVDIRKQFLSFRYQKQSTQRKSLKKQRSFYSPEQKKQVKKMFKRHQMLEDKLREKTQQALNEIRKASETQRRCYDSEMQNFKSLSKSRIEEKRQSLQIQKLQKLKQKEILNKNYEQVKSRRYVYQQMLQKDEKSAMEQMQKITRKLQCIKSKMKVSVVEELQQHKEKCHQLMKSKTTNMKSSVFSLDPQVSHLKNIQDNYFSRLAKMERDHKKEQQQIARKQPYQSKQRVKQFTQHCDNEIRPKIKITQQSKFAPLERNRSANSLNYFQQNQKGNEYLMIAKKLKKCDTLEDERAISMKEQKIHSPVGKVVYKNYLKDMRKSSQHNSETAKKKFALYLQKQGSIAGYDSLQKAVVVAKSIDAKNKRPQNQKLLDAVQNKIQILKMIM